MLTVQVATAGDAGLIADLSRRTFYETFASHNTKEDMELFMNEQFTKEQLEQEVLNSPDLFALLYHAEIPIGYLRLRLTHTPPELEPTNALEIARIYVLEEWKGKGSGTRMMQYVHTFAVQHGFEVIWLGVWEKNEPAIRFYTKWGFQQFSKHDFLLGTDVQCDWLLKKELIKK